ncbi:serpin-ZX [Tanacetum coccineum]
MIKNGGNGSFQVVFPLVRLVSSLRGFNSSGLRFLNVFYDPRIIWEQRIAALWLRGDAVDVGKMTLRAQETCMIWLGHLGGLEGDEERLCDELHKLETSFGVLDPISEDLANAPLSHRVLKKTTNNEIEEAKFMIEALETQQLNELEDLIYSSNRYAQELHEKELMITSMNKKILNKKLADLLPHSYKEEKLSKMKESLEKSRRTNKLYKTERVVTKTLLDDANNGYKNGNFACSELSLDISLGMLSPSSILLKQILSNQKTGLQFSLANGVWVDRRAEPIQSSYQKVLETVYRTEAKSVDFRDKCGEAVHKINSWVHKETKGLIPLIVERHELSQDSVMVITNALYFKGEWANPFYTHETKDKDFSET